MGNRRAVWCIGQSTCNRRAIDVQSTWSARHSHVCTVGPIHCWTQIDLSQRRASRCGTVSHLQRHPIAPSPGHLPAIPAPAKCRLVLSDTACLRTRFCPRGFAASTTKATVPSRHSWQAVTVGKVAHPERCTKRTGSPLGWHRSPSETPSCRRS